MAKSGISTFNGAINLPAGFALDCQSQRVHEHMDTQNVTAYPAIGGTPTTYAIFRGTGTPVQDITVSGFPFKGLGSTLSNPGFGKMTAANADDLGQAATFQFDTAITCTGNYIVNDVSMDHNRLVAGARTTLSLVNSTDLTVAWA